MQSHKIEKVHFTITRTIVRMREEIETLQRLDIDASIKQALVNQHYILVQELEQMRSEVMNILWS